MIDPRPRLTVNVAFALIALAVVMTLIPIGKQWRSLDAILNQQHQRQYSTTRDIAKYRKACFSLQNRICADQWTRKMFMKLEPWRQGLSWLSLLGLLYWFIGSVWRPSYTAAQQSRLDALEQNSTQEFSAVTPKSYS